MHVFYNSNWLALASLLHQRMPMPVPFASTPELDSVDADIRAFYMEDMPGRYIPNQPILIQICRNLSRLVHELPNSNGPADQGNQSENHIQG